MKTRRTSIKPNHHQVGVGATEELTLRVSVAALVRMLFNNPEDGRVMLVLERTATLREIEGRPEVAVKAKPFGGAVRLTDPQALEGVIGRFHYDSERSRREGDLRIQVHPASWEKIQRICRDHLRGTEEGILDSSPQRELAEEFEESLNVKIAPDRYTLNPQGMIIESSPEKTDNVRAQGLPTVRIYYVYEGRMEDPALIMMMLTNSKRYSDMDLQELAWEDARQGGRGRANAVLAVGLDELREVYRSVPTDRRGGPICVGEHQLDGNVQAVIT